MVSGSGSENEPLRQVLWADVGLEEPSPDDFNRTHEHERAQRYFGDILDAATQVPEMRMTMADHEGQLKKLDILISSMQSSMASMQSSFSAWQTSLGAWQNTVIGVAAAIGIAIALLGGFEVWSLSETSGLSTETSSKFDTMDRRLQGIESNQKTLPAEISQQMLAVAASLATVRGPAPQPPPRPR